MDHSMLPLNYFCRKIRLCMKKAAFSKKAQLFGDELLHLKKILTLIVTSIPSHPLYEEKKTEKQILEFESLLPEIKKRIQQLEAELDMSNTSKNTSGPLNGTNLHHTSLPVSGVSSEVLLMVPQQAHEPGPAKKSKQAVSRKPRKQHIRELCPVLNASEIDQVPPSKSNPVSPQKVHPIDDSRCRSSRREFLSSSKNFFYDHIPHCMVQRITSLPNGTNLSNENDSSPSQNGSLFSSPAQETACLDPHQDSGKCRGSFETKYSCAKSMRKMYVCGDFRNEKVHSPRKVDNVSSSYPHGECTMHHYGDNMSAVGHRDRLPHCCAADLSVLPQEPGDEWKDQDATNRIVSSVEISKSYVMSCWKNKGRDLHCSSPNNIMVKNEPVKREGAFPIKMEGDAEALLAGIEHQWEKSDSQARDLAAEKSVDDDRLSAQPSTKVSKEKDILTTTIRSEFEEEHEELIEHRRWSNHHQSPLDKDIETDLTIQKRLPSSKVMNVHSKRIWDGMDKEHTGLNLMNGICENDCNSNGEGIQNTQASWAQDNVDSYNGRYTVPSHETPNNVHPVSDMISSMPFPHPTLLPFSHYISKLKQLVLNDTTHFQPLHLMNSHTHSIGPGSDSLFHVSEQKETAALNDQPKNAHDHSSSSTDTFSDSLTYSNPVFELEGESSLLKHSLTTMRLDKGPKKQKLILAEGITEEKVNFSSFEKNLEVEDSSLTGPEFHHVNELLLNKAQTSINCEKVNNSYEEVKNVKGSMPRKCPTLSKLDTNHALLGSVIEDKDLRWTNLRKCIGKPAPCIQNSSLVLSKEGASMQDEATLINIDTGSETLVPLKEAIDVSFKDKSIQNSAMEPLQGSSIKDENQMFSLPLEKQGFIGLVCIKDQDDVLNHGGHVIHSRCCIEDESRLMAKIDQLEQELNEYKHEVSRNSDFIHKKMDELGTSVQLTKELLMNKNYGKECFTNGLNIKIEDYEGNSKLMQEQVDGLVKQINCTSTKEPMEKIRIDQQAVKRACTDQLETLEREMSTNMELLRNEMASSMDFMRDKIESRVNIHYEDLKGSLLQKIDNGNAFRLSSERDTIAEIRSELCLIWDKIHKLSKGSDEMKEQVGDLMKASSETKEYINREHSNFLTESEIVKRNMKKLKKANMKSRKEGQEFKREMEEIVKSFHNAFAQIEEGSKKESENSKRIHESLLSNRICVQNLYEKLRQTEGAMKEDIRRMESIREEVLSYNTRSSIAERQLAIERVNELSHYYLNALEEVRRDLLAVKMIGQDRLQDMEYRWENFMRSYHQITLDRQSSLHDLVMDGLESRVSHLEHILGSSDDLQRAQFKVDTILAITERDQECASASAAKAMASAQRAEILAAVVESFKTEIEIARNNNLGLQHALELEREAAATVCMEIRTLHADLLQEKNSALAASSEVKKRSFEIWESLQNDLMSLRSSLCLIDKDKETVSAAANEVTAAVSQAQALLEGLTKTSEEVSALHAGMVDAADTLKAIKEMDSSQEREGRHSEVQETMEKVDDIMTALNRLGESSAQLDEELRKQDTCLLDLGKQIMAVTVEQKEISKRLFGVTEKVEGLGSLNFSSQVLDEAQRNTEDLEKAATVLELKKRICYLENLLQIDNLFETNVQHLDGQQTATIGKEHLSSVHKEMSTFLRRLQKIEEQGVKVLGADKQVQVAFISLVTRFTNLENRVHQLETKATLITRNIKSVQILQRLPKATTRPFSTKRLLFMKR
ncbi:hypothetical protein KP509_17G000800 [Ceratopteris richardii]|uniref:Uncharacterized protein n=1 Tax=Ceratopteris richardii TaxID=49495 RepID=A0A8T2SW95_CERRI|nr:hypothetical protein KP509_17G000800 [Ceratopteris richardii]